jgi:hypothetical protein
MSNSVAGRAPTEGSSILERAAPASAPAASAAVIPAAPLPAAASAPGTIPTK